MSHHSTSTLKTKVETTDGGVALSGVAKNSAEKGLASKIVNDIEAVSRVINNVTVPIEAAAR